MNEVDWERFNDNLANRQINFLKQEINKLKQDKARLIEALKYAMRSIDACDDCGYTVRERVEFSKIRNLIKESETEY